MCQLDQRVKFSYLGNVNRVSHHRLLKDTPVRFAELLGIPIDALKIEREPVMGDQRPDLVIRWDDNIVIGECKASGETATVAMASRQMQNYLEHLNKKAIPLISVPYMGEAGRRICAEANISWLDLSGNAHLAAPGLRVEIEGKPNRFKRAGRPRSLFAPKSARIARWLLMKSDQAFTQRELARMSGLDEGFTSRIVHGLEEQQLIVRENDGAVRVSTNYDALLDALHEAYDFSKHRIVRGHISARSSDGALRRMAEALQQEKIEYAATGLAGAWLLSGFAGFRLSVMFVADLPDEKTRLEIGFQEVERGENVWLVEPNDAGVFQGSEIREGITCANPVQVYLDLKDHPERSAEAAENLREKFLKPALHV